MRFDPVALFPFSSSKLLKPVAGDLPSRSLKCLTHLHLDVIDTGGFLQDTRHLTCTQHRTSVLLTMDFKWPHTDAEKRPRFLYRVFHIHTLHPLIPNTGLVASNTHTIIASDRMEDFIQSVRDQRNQVKKPSPYISCFADLAEAQQFAIAADDRFGSTGYKVRMVKIDMQCEELATRKMFYVQDIQDVWGEDCGFGGARNSEWLVLHKFPRSALRPPFTTAVQIRDSE